MNKIYFSLLAVLACAGLKAQTTHFVEAGGSMMMGFPDPYFAPQFITIDQGDIVQWTNVQGTHAVDGTTFTFPDNPESFTSGNSGSGWVFSHTFSIPGFYNYECPVGNHALTQFGTITVVAVNNIEEGSSENALVVYPNPTNGDLFVTSNQAVNSYEVLTLEGMYVKRQVNFAMENRIDLNGLAAGTYILQLNTSNAIEIRKIVIQ